ncbi:2,4-diaminobutyrate 4-aminotransferase [Hapalosiphon sp. MRB220]|nr:2,4-diaminobutyrate 4-aminotransferase [Hapalosiphon sp. MRB220]
MQTQISNASNIQPIVKTSIPGPKTLAFLQKQEQNESNARTYPRNIPIAIERAIGSYIEDVDGNIFIDFLTGAGVLSLGHSHPEIVREVQQQMNNCCHALDIPTKIKSEFTELQLSMLPSTMRNNMKIHFCGPTGADAVEAAIKICKTYTGRAEVVSFQGAYHGSTHAAMSVSGLLEQKNKIHNIVPGVHFFPFAYCYRCPMELSYENCSTNCTKYLENSLKDSHGGIQKPAAVIMELIQGEGGTIPAPIQFVQEVRRITQELDIPLIVDEVQTGCGRTGTWFAFEQFGITPDIILASKALSGIGMPVSIVIYNKKFDVWSPGAHIGTFRGNQLAFAAGAAALKIIKRDNILENVKDLSCYLMEHLNSLKQELAIIGDVRGRGFMIGIEIVEPHTNKGAGWIAKLIRKELLANGLIIELGGRNDCVIRLLPPLNVDRNTVDAALKILEHGLRTVEASIEQKLSGNLVSFS